MNRAWFSTHARGASSLTCCGRKWHEQVSAAPLRYSRHSCGSAPTLSGSLREGGLCLKLQDDSTSPGGLGFETSPSPRPRTPSLRSWDTLLPEKHPQTHPEVCRSSVLLRGVLGRHTLKNTRKRISPSSAELPCDPRTCNKSHLSPRRPGKSHLHVGSLQEAPSDPPATCWPPSGTHRRTAAHTGGWDETGGQTASHGLLRP